MLVLGIDYGEKRVGVAISDHSGIISMPREVLEVNSDKMAFKKIKAVCEESGAEKVVIGLPVNMNGSQGPMAEKVKAFAQTLEGIIGLPVDLWDERLSSSAAERVLLEADMSRSRRKQVVDKLAAQVILQGYLDKVNLKLEA